MIHILGATSYRILFYNVTLREIGSDFGPVGDELETQFAEVLREANSIRGRVRQTKQSVVSF